MNRHSSFRNLAASCIAAGLIALAGLTSAARAADLGPYGAQPSYEPVPVSPCAEYGRIYSDALRTARQIAAVFLHHDREFHRLKRYRANDGFDGPDIRVNRAMTREQIDVAELTARVEIYVHKARQLGCAAPVRLNQIDNAAARLSRSIAEAGFWVDPQSYY